MIIHLKIIGGLFVLLALMHAGFPKYFNWKEELSSLSILSRQMFKVHTFFIALMVLFVGLLCILKTESLVETELGNFLCLGLALYWGNRLFFQLFVYSKKLWKGKNFETIIHFVFTGFWTYLTVVFGSIYFLNS